MIKKQSVDSVDKQFDDIVLKKFGFDRSHLTMTHSLWNFATFDKKEFFETKGDIPMGQFLDKLWDDQLERSKALLKPEEISLKIHGMDAVHAAKDMPNILTNLGMTEMARRSVGSSSTANTHHAIGTGTTAETVNDTVLETEIARKEIASRTVIGQTERYNTPFLDTDVTPPQNVSEAAVFTAAMGGIMVSRVTAIPVVLDTGVILTVQTNITHQNGTQV